jgi:hypothetical protein
MGAGLMKPSDVIFIQLLHTDGRVLELNMVQVAIGFFLHDVFRYEFTFGPTDDQGRLRVAYEDIERNRLESLRVQPWDYKTTLEECDRRIKISTDSQAELEKAIRIATSFNLGETPQHLRWWAKANNRMIQCEPVYAELRPGENVVQIPCRLI